MTFEIDGFTPTGILGRGGFGTVHRASDDAHGREVAVKILGRIDDDGAKRRFDRERRAMGTLSGHPNIGIVYTSGFTTTNEPYIVMELIRGGSLADRIERDGPMPPAEVVELGATLAEALQHAHDGGVLHLDLKPENILMSQFGRPKIVDFGIAALIDDESRTATIRATPSYADPDVLEGRPGTERSDVYGLAATLYTLLTGKPPYADGPSGLYQVMRRVALDPVPRVTRGDASTELADLLVEAMAKDPADRPTTMQEFAERLRSVEVEPTTRPRPDRASGATARRSEPQGPAGPLPDTSAASGSWVGAARSTPAAPPTPAAPAPHPPAPQPAAPVRQATPASPAPPHYHVVPASAPVFSGPVASGPIPRPAIAQGTIRRTGRGLVVGLSLVAVALAATLVVLVLQQRGGGPEVVVPTPVESPAVSSASSEVAEAAELPTAPAGIIPDVTGRTEAVAIEALRSAGYLPVVAPHCYDAVAGQEPLAGVPADPGTAIQLSFEPCTVPDFVGLQLPDAITIVEDEIVTGITIRWPEHCDNLILGQSVAPGTQVDPGTTVDLVLRETCG